MVVVELRSAVVLCGEADHIQSQIFGFLFDPLGKLAGTGQVGNRPPTGEGMIGDQQRQQCLALAGGHLDGQIRGVEVLVRVRSEDLALTRPKLGEPRRIEVHQVLLEVRRRRVSHRSLLSREV